MFRHKIETVNIHRHAVSLTNSMNDVCEFYVCVSILFVLNLILYERVNIYQKISLFKDLDVTTY